MIRKAVTSPAADTIVEGPHFAPVVDDTEEVTLQDLDFVFVGPMTFSVVLDPLDTITDQAPDYRRLTFHKNGETVDINTANLLYVSTRTRLVVRKKPKEPHESS